MGQGEGRACCEKPASHCESCRTLIGRPRGVAPHNDLQLRRTMPSKHVGHGLNTLEWFQCSCCDSWLFRAAWHAPDLEVWVAEPDVVTPGKVPPSSVDGGQPTTP